VDLLGVRLPGDGEISHADVVALLPRQQGPGVHRTDDRPATKHQRRTVVTPHGQRLVTHTGINVAHHTAYTEGATPTGAKCHPVRRVGDEDVGREPGVDLPAVAVVDRDPVLVVVGDGH